jgi:hypothetical protein
VNQQQGFTCTHCRANLRGMTLARAVMTAFQYEGLFREWVRDLTLAVLEINEAQALSPFLSQITGHELTRFPEVDMRALLMTIELLILLFIPIRLSTSGIR